ncbi:MAG: chromate resistance protein [Gemmatimonadetes bacterium]|nr:chromate resistance protein [Gemmatimonadota bacterium]
MEDAPGARWLLLIHQIPPKPGYFRVKVWRRLQRLGSVALKNSVYVLPASEQAREDFEWMLREIVEGGGGASICEVAFVGGLSDQEVEALFRAARDADYARIAEDARAILSSGSAGERIPDALRGQVDSDVVRLRRRLAEVVAIDFCGAPGRESAEELLAAVERRLLGGVSEPRPGGAGVESEQLRGRVWVTRRGIQVDRMASAWLILRFIDPEARFKFVVGRGYRAERGEIRFDMFEADFTHQGDRCTFEILLERVGLEDPGLRAIAEIVHDIDLKDAKFGRAETPGIERLITGMQVAQVDDEARLSRGVMLFDDLYAAYGQGGAARERGP